MANENAPRDDNNVPSLLVEGAIATETYRVKGDGSGGLYSSPSVLAPLGYQQRTISNSAVGFTSVPAGSTMAVVTIEDDDIRWRDDGTSPTSSVGMIAKQDSTITFENLGNLSAIKFIRITADAKINVSFYG